MDGVKYKISIVKIEDGKYMPMITDKVKHWAFGVGHNGIYDTLDEAMGVVENYYDIDNMEWSGVIRILEDVE